uniref:Uncharacterized protein n=1 Tax=Setaria italica TaxID=4555 RepID=K3XN19_SETIT
MADDTYPRKISIKAETTKFLYGRPTSTLMLQDQDLDDTLDKGGKRGVRDAKDIKNINHNQEGVTLHRRRNAGKGGSRNISSMLFEILLPHRSCDYSTKSSYKLPISFEPNNVAFSVFLTSKFQPCVQERTRVLKQILEY